MLRHRTASSCQLRRFVAMSIDSCKAVWERC